MKCEECGTPQALARSWYDISPESGRPRAGCGWCGGCYEKLHARYIRELYRRRDEQQQFLLGESERQAVRIF